MKKKILIGLSLVSFVIAAQATSIPESVSESGVQTTGDSQTPSTNGNDIKVNTNPGMNGNRIGTDGAGIKAGGAGNAAGAGVGGIGGAGSAGAGAGAGAGDVI